METARADSLITTVAEYGARILSLLERLTKPLPDGKRGTGTRNYLLAVRDADERFRDRPEQEHG